MTTWGIRASLRPRKRTCGVMEAGAIIKRDWPCAWCLWSVDDRATQFLMTETFTYYAGNTSPAPAQALRRGMRALMAEGRANPEHAYVAHPFAWAAFFLVGEGRQ